MEYHKNIIFCKTKLYGCFRYKDEFQIYPAEFDGMPRSELQNHHPIVLEYIIREEEKIIPNAEEDDALKDLRILTASTLSKQDKIISILSIISNHLFFRIVDLTGYWGLPILFDNPGEVANQWSSKWNMAMFHWPAYPEQFKITEFSKIDLDKVELIEHFRYYYHDPNFDFHPDKGITFPTSIYGSLDSYFAKSSETLLVIDSAISFVYSAMEMRLFKKTLSIISSFTAIETLVNFEFKDFKPTKCDTCGQLQFKVSQKYRDFLMKYIGSNANNKKKFNDFYKLRSSIVHTGQRLKTEDLYADMPKEQKDKEFITHLEILQMSKLSIVHWLGLNK